MAERGFRFGIIAGYMPDMDAVARTARRAEELGYDTLLTPDPVGEHDPLSLLSAVAAVTTTLHFGTFVLADPFRDRRMLRWQAQTLHKLSGGRFELGIGTGRPGSEERAAGLGRPYASDRVERLAETLAELKQDEDRPPLLVAAGGPKMLELAARAADIVSLTWPPTTTIDEADAMVSRFRALAGDRADRIELNLNLIAVGDGEAPQARKFIGLSTAELAAKGAVTVLPGTPEEGARTLREWRERLGITYVTVNAGFLDQFAPIVAQLRGA